MGLFGLLGLLGLFGSQLAALAGSVQSVPDRTSPLHDMVSPATRNKAPRVVLRMKSLHERVERLSPSLVTFPTRRSVKITMPLKLRMCATAHPWRSPGGTGRLAILTQSKILGSGNGLLT